MDNENVGYTYTKQYYSAICDNMDDPGRYYVKWNKPVTKRQILHDSAYMKNCTGKLIETENTIVVAKGWGKGEWGVVIPCL